MPGMLSVVHILVVCVNIFMKLDSNKNKFSMKLNVLGRAAETVATVTASGL